jgi:hypothetical protein
MLAETAEQFGLDGVERIRPLQAHDQSRFAPTNSAM